MGFQRSRCETSNTCARRRLIEPKIMFAVISRNIDSHTYQSAPLSPQGEFRVFEPPSLAPPLPLAAADANVEGNCEGIAHRAEYFEWRAALVGGRKTVLFESRSGMAVCGECRSCEFCLRNATVQGRQGWRKSVASKGRCKPKLQTNGEMDGALSRSWGRYVVFRGRVVQKQR